MRWLRVVLPDIGWAALVLLGYALFAGFEAFFLWQLGVKISEFDRTQAVYLVLAAAGYGVYRVVRFHPVLRESYLAWLKMTPWMRNRPTPLGPVHLVPQDVVVFGAIALLSWEADVRGPALAALAFAAGYLIALAVVFFQIRQTIALYAVIFSLGLMLRVMPDIVLSIGVGMVTYAVLIWRRLVGYPWTEESHWTDALRRSTGDGANELGWPFGRMGPQFVREDHIPLRDAMFIALLYGWLGHVYLHVVSRLAQPPLESAALFPYGVLIVAGVSRLATYLQGYLPPISLLGRLLTGRLIIPRYDQVFAAPLSMIVVTVLLNWFRPPGLPDDVFHPTVWTTGLLIILAMGPQLTTWRLTGNHRVVMLRGKLEQAG